MNARRRILAAAAAVVAFGLFGATPVAEWTEFGSPSATGEKTLTYTAGDGTSGYAITVTNGQAIAGGSCIELGASGDCSVSFTLPAAITNGYALSLIAEISQGPKAATNLVELTLGSGSAYVRLKTTAAPYTLQQCWGDTANYGQSVWVPGAHQFLTLTYNGASEGTATYLGVGEAIASSALRSNNNKITALSFGNNANGMKIHALYLYAARLSAAEVSTAVSGYLPASTATKTATVSGEQTWGELSWGDGVAAPSETETAILSTVGASNTLTLSDNLSLNALTIGDSAGANPLTLRVAADTAPNLEVLGQTTIAADTDLSAIPAYLPMLSVASGKRLTLGADSILTLTNSPGAHIVHTGSATYLASALRWNNTSLASLTVNAGTVKLSGGQQTDVSTAFTVGAGATLDIAGMYNQAAGLTLGDGATVTNSGSDAAVGQKQWNALTLQANASATISGNQFGLIASNYNAMPINLAGGTLSVAMNSGKIFHMANVYARAAASDTEASTGKAGTIKAVSGQITLLNTNDGSGDKANTRSLSRAEVVLAGGTVYLNGGNGNRFGTLSGTGGTLNVNAQTLEVGALGEERNCAATLTSSATSAELRKVGAAKLTLSGTLSGFQGKYNVTAGTLNLGTSALHASSTFAVSEGATLALTKRLTGSGVLSGSGRVEVTGALMAASALTGDWRGTLAFKDHTGPTGVDSSGTGKIDLDGWGERVELENVKGWFANGAVGERVTLTGNGVGVNNGSSSVTTQVTFKVLDGTGTILGPSEKDWNYVFFVNDASAFRGGITMPSGGHAGNFAVVIGPTPASYAHDTYKKHITVMPGGVAYVASGKTWQPGTGAQGITKVQGTIGGAGSLKCNVTLASGAVLDCTTGEALSVVDVNTSTQTKATVEAGVTVRVNRETASAGQVILNTREATAAGAANFTVRYADGALAPFAVAPNADGTAYCLAAYNQVECVAGAEALDLGAGALPERVLLSGFFGYGRHTLLTYSGEANLSTLNVEGLPSGAAVTVTRDEASGQQTWGFTLETLVLYPLGDSITHGRTRFLRQPSTYDGNTPGGYRLPLYTRLTEAGYNVQFVGTSAENPATGLGSQIRHDGHSGWKVSATSNGVYENVGSWASAVRTQAGRAPDAILLLLGVNDLNGGEAATETTEQMKRLLWRLAGIGPAVAGDTPLYPGSTVLLAKVLDSTYESNTTTGTALSEQIDAYNAALVTFVEALSEAEGRDRIRVVDLNLPLNAEHGFEYFRYDNLHPSGEGYTQMARKWFAAVEALLPPLETASPATVRVQESATVERVVLAFNKVMAPEAVQDPANYTLSRGSVASATLLDDGLTVVLTLGADAPPSTQVTLTVSPMCDKYGIESEQTALNLRLGPKATRCEDITDGVCDRTAAGYANALDLLAEWSTFDHAPTETEGLPAQFGSALRAERPWSLKLLRQGERAPTVEDGVLCLNGGAVTVEVNADAAVNTSEGCWTVIVETVDEVAPSTVLFAMRTEGGTVPFEDLYGLRLGEDASTFYTVNAAVDALNNTFPDRTGTFSGALRYRNQFAASFGDCGYAAWVNGQAITFESAAANDKYSGKKLLNITFGGTNNDSNESALAFTQGSNLKISRIAICHGLASETVLRSYVAATEGAWHWAGTGPDTLWSTADNWRRGGRFVAAAPEGDPGRMTVAANKTLTLDMAQPTISTLVPEGPVTVASETACTLGALGGAGDLTLTPGTQLTITGEVGEATGSDEAAVRTTRYVGSLTLGDNARLTLLGTTPATITGSLLGSGTLALGDGTQAVDVTFNSPATLEGAITVADKASLTVGAGACTAELSIAGTLRVSGAFTWHLASGGTQELGALTIDKGATLALAAQSSEVTLSVPALTVNGVLAVADGAAATASVTVGKAQTLTGNGTLRLPVTFAEGGTIVLPESEYIEFASGLTLPASGKLPVRITKLRSGIILSVATASLSETAFTVASGSVEGVEDYCFGLAGWTGMYTLSLVQKPTLPTLPGVSNALSEAIAKEAAANWANSVTTITELTTVHADGTASSGADNLSIQAAELFDNVLAVTVNREDETMATATVRYDFGIDRLRLRRAALGNDTEARLYVVLCAKVAGDPAKVALGKGADYASGTTVQLWVDGTNSGLSPLAEADLATLAITPAAGERWFALPFVQASGIKKLTVQATK